MSLVNATYFSFVLSLIQSYSVILVYRIWQSVASIRVCCVDLSSISLESSNKKNRKSAAWHTHIDRICVGRRSAHYEKLLLLLFAFVFLWFIRCNYLMKESVLASFECRQGEKMYIYRMRFIKVKEHCDGYQF